MKIIEYRVFMPLTVEENQIGQLWSFAEVSRVNTSGGEGVEILQNKSFEVPVNEENKINFKQLPDYENYETQIADSASASSSTTNQSQTSVKNKLLNKLPFKKSASKENFKNKNLLLDHERSKSLDFGDSLDSNGGSDEFPILEGNCISLNDTQIKNGQYTHKIYKMASKLPWFVRKLLPKDSTIIREKSWNCYPVVKTVITNDYFTNNFRIEMDTITKACENGIAEDNVHNLSPEQLEKREIVNIDIAEQVPPNEYKEDEDPSIFKSVKTGRGPLVNDWITKTKPLLCVYKLVTLEFKVFGLQTRSENYLKSMYKQLFATFHREIFCWIDKWHGMTLEDVRAIEKELADILVKKIQEGEISKCALIESD
jgi:hypothetical protein